MNVFESTIWLIIGNFIGASIVYVSIKLKHIAKEVNKLRKEKREYLKERLERSIDSYFVLQKKTEDLEQEVYRLTAERARLKESLERFVNMKPHSTPLQWKIVLEKAQAVLESLKDKKEHYQEYENQR